MAINTNLLNLFYVFLVTDTTLDASTSLLTTQSLESAALRTENITVMMLKQYLKHIFFLIMVKLE